MPLDEAIDPGRMGNVDWSPRCERPAVLVQPFRVGEYGLTHAEARNTRLWRKVAPAYYLPTSVDSGVVEQRILEHGPRIENCGAITGWASLRWQGGRFFDGTTEGGRVILPVPLLVYSNTNLRPARGAKVTRARRHPDEIDWVGGIWCTVPERATYDEVCRTRSLYRGVAAVDMAAAAGLVTVRGMWDFIYHFNGRLGVPHVRDVLSHAIDESRSPQETRLRLVWTLEAGFPEPLCNRPIFGRDGSFLGMPDLFDPEAGLVGEYDGAHHLENDQRRADRTREERFRDHGLEYFAVVKGEFATTAKVVRRMHAARRRAQWLPPERRNWTLDAPDWWNERHGG